MLTDGFGNIVKYNCPGVILPRGALAMNGFLHSQAVEVVTAILVSNERTPSVTLNLEEA